MENIIGLPKYDRKHHMLTQVWKKTLYAYPSLIENIYGFTSQIENTIGLSMTDSKHNRFTEVWEKTPYAYPSMI